MCGDLDESDSNFMQLLMPQGIDDPMIMQTVEKKQINIRVHKYRMRFCQSLLFKYSEISVILSDHA